MKLALAPPDVPLSEGTVRLRSPRDDDAEALAAYASEPGQLDGIWVPASLGSEPFELLLEVAGATRFVGYVVFAARGEGVVELIYGIAPDWRGRGLATRAARLATSWLLKQPGVSSVELRIAPEHAASRRVAEKAGFQLAGTVRQVVAGTGETFDDLRYVRSAGPFG